MAADGEYVAVVDRFEEDERERLAVLLLERDGRQEAELVVPADDLPADAGQDAVLDVRVSEGELVAVEFRPDETADRKTAAQDRFDRLARRPGEEGRDDASPGDGGSGDDDRGCGGDHPDGGD